MGAWSVVIRTVIIDNLISEAIAEGVDTILNLGAGLDTRPYRMALPKTLRWVEVDYPHVIALKEERLASDEPCCRLDRIKLDLTDRAARRQFLADMSADAGKILVLTEGVAPYLAETDVAELADDLKAAEKVRFWIVDYFSTRGHSLWQEGARPFHAQYAVSLFAEGLVRLLRPSWLAGR